MTEASGGGIPISPTLPEGWKTNDKFLKRKNVLINLAYPVKKGKLSMPQPRSSDYAQGDPAFPVFNQTGVYSEPIVNNIVDSVTRLSETVRVGQFRSIGTQMWGARKEIGCQTDLTAFRPNSKNCLNRLQDFVEDATDGRLLLCHKKLARSARMVKFQEMVGKKFELPAAADEKEVENKEEELEAESENRSDQNEADVSTEEAKKESCQTTEVEMPIFQSCQNHATSECTSLEKLVEVKSEPVEVKTEADQPPGAPISEHLLEYVGPVRLYKKRCRLCYQLLTEAFGSKIASAKSKQVNTKCSQCQFFFCVDCFNAVH